MFCSHRRCVIKRNTNLHITAYVLEQETLLTFVNRWRCAFAIRAICRKCDSRINCAPTNRAEVTNWGRIEFWLLTLKPNKTYLPTRQFIATRWDVCLKVTSKLALLFSEHIANNATVLFTWAVSVELAHWRCNVYDALENGPRISDIHSTICHNSNERSNGCFYCETKQTKPEIPESQRQQRKSTHWIGAVWMQQHFKWKWKERERKDKHIILLYGDEQRRNNRANITMAKKILSQRINRAWNVRLHHVRACIADSCDRNASTGKNSVSGHQTRIGSVNCLQSQSQLCRIPEILA